MTLASNASPIAIRTTPTHITLRPPQRSMSRPTEAETRPWVSIAMVKPRKTKLRVKPRSWPIGPASTPRQ